MADGDTISQPTQPQPMSSGMDTLYRLGQVFGYVGAQESAAQQQRKMETQKAMALDLMASTEARAKAGDVSYFQDPETAKRLKKIGVGPLTMDSWFPTQAEIAKHNANINETKANIMRFAAALAQSQQAGTKLAPNAIPTLVGKGAELGIKPADITSTGLTLKSPQTKLPGDIEARAMARGYNSFKDAPAKVRREIVNEADVAGKETPGEAYAKELARKKADIEAAKMAAPAEGGVTAAAEKPPPPGYLPPVMNFEQWKAQNPTITDPKMQNAAFQKEQGAYKKAMSDMRLIQTSKERALKIRDNIIRYMDENNIKGGGAVTTAEFKLWGHAPNLAPKKYQKLYTMLSQLYATAAPGYIAKGSPRSKMFLDQMTKHLPQATDNPDFIREQMDSLKPFLEGAEDENRQAIANDFGVPYTPAPSSGADVSDALEKYKKPDGTYDLDAIRRDPNLK